jgi:predicted DCC family thiol-disulfide oxidoreductase YuxK
MKTLTVLYDGSCGFCVECARWLATQPQLVRLELLPSSTIAARTRFPTLTTAGATEELIVVDDEGGVYRGTHAWIMCLWALRPYRNAAKRLASPALLPLARATFALVSRSRLPLSRWLDLAPDAEVQRAAAQGAPPSCEAKGTG